MPDWQKIVRNRLSGLALDAGEKDEVYTELAAHLEEAYAAFREEGLHKKEAVHRTLAHVADWQDLQRKILKAKRRGYPMKKRLHQLWVPGFLTLILSTFSLMAAQTCGFQPPIFWSGPKQILVYVPWLLSLPFFGALGAYVSWRAGGSRAAMLLSSVFPSVALALAFVLMFPIEMIVERVTGKNLDFATVATALLSDGIGWIVLPGAALLVGGLLVHLLFSQRSSSQGTAIS